MIIIIKFSIYFFFAKMVACVAGNLFYGDLSKYLSVSFNISAVAQQQRRQPRRRDTPYKFERERKEHRLTIYSYVL